MGLTLAAQEASFLSQLKGEMDGVEREVDRKGIRLLTDSQSAKALAENPVYHGRSKHILAEWHFVRERVESGQVKLEDVRTAYIAADMLTKSVGPAILAVDMKSIGMNVKSGLSNHMSRSCISD